MPSSKSPSPPSLPSPASSKLWLSLGAAALVVAALLWFTLGRDQGDGAQARPEASADPTDRLEHQAAGAGSASAEIASARASGQVRSTSGEAITGAVVTLAPLEDGGGGGEPKTLRSDDGGAWSIQDIPAGRYALSASAAGFLAAVSPEITLRANNDNSGLDLSLEPGGNTLSGTVSDKTGGVIEGALVQVTPQSGITRMRERDSYFTLTNDQGRYAVQVPDGRHRVRASHIDYTSEAVVLEFARQPAKQDFALIPTAVIEGVVLRESDGAPVPRAEVSWARERSIMLPGGGRMNTYERGGKVRADDEGRFRLSGLPPGTVELSAHASMLTSAAPVQIPVGIAEHIQHVQLPLAAARDVSGRVVAASDGEGIAAVRVELMSKIGDRPAVLTDERGQFTIRGVLPGSYRARAEAEGWTSPEGPPPMIEVGEGASSILIELERGISIRGRIEPAARAEVAIEFQPEGVRMSGGMMMLAAGGPTQANADSGAFELGPVRPGHYTLEARTADGRGGSVEVDVGPEGAQDVVIALEQRAILSGHVEDANGQLVRDVSVRARKRKSGGSSLSVVVNGRELTALSSPTSTEGRFEIAGLAAGPWVIEVVDAQGDVLPMQDRPGLDLDLGEAETKQIVLRVEPRDGTISGTVRDADGHAVADAWVSAAFVPQLGGPMKAAPGGEGDDEGGHGGGSQMKMIVATDDGSSLRSLPPVLTDADGRFVFQKLRRGDYTLTAELDGGTSKATLDGVRPDAELTLDLAPLGKLEGKVLSNGQPANCIAQIMGPSQRSVRVREGKFEAERLEPGHYRVEASTGDGATAVEVEIEAGATATVELSLERFAKVTGTIVDEQGEPIANAEIMIGSGSGGRVEISQEDGDPQILTKEDGSFETNAAAGARVLIAQAPGVPMPIVIKPFVVEAGQDVDLGQLRKKAMEMMMMEEGPEGAEGEAEGEAGG